MWFWWFMFICDFIVPAAMILGGRMMWKYPPKSINGMVGYRTRRSMKNKETWKFAQEYCGRLWWKIGWLMSIPSALVHIPFYGKSEGMVGILGGIVCTLECVVMISTIYFVEKALKRFDMGYGDYTKEKQSQPDEGLEEIDALLKDET